MRNRAVATARAISSDRRILDFRRNWHSKSSGIVHHAILVYSWWSLRGDRFERSHNSKFTSLRELEAHWVESLRRNCILLHLRSHRHAYCHVENQSGPSAQ